MPIRLTIMICLILLTIPMYADKNDPENIIIPHNIREAYDAMSLSATQQTEFDPLMKDVIERIKSVIRREIRREDWYRERRIKKKSQSLLKSNEPSLTAVLSPHQISAFNTYAELVLETLTTRKSVQYEGNTYDSGVGLTERSD